MLARDPFTGPSQPSLAVAADPHAIQATPSLSPEKHIMQTRVAVRDKTPHRFQVVPLREIRKQKDLLEDEGPSVAAFHAGTLLCSPSGNLPPPARSPTKETKDPFDRSYRDMHWRKFGTLPRSIPLSQVMDLTKPASPTPIRPPPPRNVLSEVDPNQSRATSRHHASRPPPLDPSVSLGLQQRKRAQNATAIHQRNSSSSRYATAPSLVPPPPPSMIPSTRAPASIPAESFSSAPMVVDPPSNAVVHRTGRRKGRTMSENALSEDMRHISQDPRASRRHAMYRQSLHFLDITRNLEPTPDDGSPEADEETQEGSALEATAGPSSQTPGQGLAARSRMVAKSILERAMGEHTKPTLAPETHTQPLRWKFPERTVRRVPSFDAEADLGPLPAPTDITYSPIVLSLFAEIDQAIEEWKTVGN